MVYEYRIVRRRNDRSVLDGIVSDSIVMCQIALGIGY